MNPARISAPALAVAGELDPSAPTIALKDLVETLPSAVYLKLPTTGHYLNIEEPVAFYRGRLSTLSRSIRPAGEKKPAQQRPKISDTNDIARF